VIVESICIVREATIVKIRFCVPVRDVEHPEQTARIGAIDRIVAGECVRVGRGRGLWSQQRIAALPLLHAGETAVLWLPPRPGTLEPVAYEVELVEVLATRPASTAAASSSG
jgi:hypothetical protein